MCKLCCAKTQAIQAAEQNSVPTFFSNQVRMIHNILQSNLNLPAVFKIIVDLVCLMGRRSHLVTILFGKINYVLDGGYQGTPPPIIIIIYVKPFPYTAPYKLVFQSIMKGDHKYVVWTK